MRIRVAVDITRPLCRGSKVAFEENKEGWVSFQYERLPNLCFWCGMLSHDDKDYELWLRSKGTLPLERQQYRHWIKASVFSMSKRQVLEVKGFDELNRKSQRTQSYRNAPARVREEGMNPLVPLLPEVEESGATLVSELAAGLPVVNTEDTPLDVDAGLITRPPNIDSCPANFEELIDKIDSAL